MLTWLQSRPDGATVAETRDHFKRAGHAISCGIARLHSLGLLGFLDVPNPSTQRRAKATVRRYWAREHCPPGATLAAEVKPLKRAMNGAPKLEKVPAAPNRNTIVKPKPPKVPTKPEGEAINPGVVAVVLPGFERAFQQPAPQPFFAAGKRLEPRPWAAAVAGSGR